jgi:hypothetical protein
MDNVHTLYAEPKYALEPGKTAVRFIVDKDIGCILTVVPIVKYPDNSSTVVCLVPPAVDGFFDEYQRHIKVSKLDAGWSPIDEAFGSLVRFPSATLFSAPKSSVTARKRVRETEHVLEASFDIGLAEDISALDLISYRLKIIEFLSEGGYDLVPTLTDIKEDCEPEILASSKNGPGVNESQIDLSHLASLMVEKMRMDGLVGQAPPTQGARQQMELPAGNFRKEEGKTSDLKDLLLALGDREASGLTSLQRLNEKEAAAPQAVFSSMVHRMREVIALGPQAELGNYSDHLYFADKTFPRRVFTLTQQTISCFEKGDLDGVAMGLVRLARFQDVRARDSMREDLAWTLMGATDPCSKVVGRTSSADVFSGITPEGLLTAAQSRLTNQFSFQKKREQQTDLAGGKKRLCQSPDCQTGVTGAFKFCAACWQTRKPTDKA